ncbi:MAG: hypothetical protein Q4F84_07335 [Fibrobacter sp.]|nr:hypothetical protein [Fibrobacter sp.]
MHKKVYLFEQDIMQKTNRTRSILMWIIVAMTLSLGNLHPGFSAISRHILDFTTLILAAGHIQWIYQNKRRLNRIQRQSAKKITTVPEQNE